MEEVIDDGAAFVFAPREVNGASSRCVRQGYCPNGRRRSVGCTEGCDGDPEPYSDQVHYCGPMRGFLNNVGMPSSFRDRAEIEPVCEHAGGFRVKNERLVSYVLTCERLRMS